MIKYVIGLGLLSGVLLAQFIVVREAVLGVLKWAGICRRD